MRANGTMSAPASNGKFVSVQAAAQVIMTGFFPIRSTGLTFAENVLNNLRNYDNGQIIAPNRNKEPSPMWIRESEQCLHEQQYVQWNWVAIFSYSVSLAISVAIWKGLFLAVTHLVK
jgi:hypothetical protein